MPPGVARPAASVLLVCCGVFGSTALDRGATLPAAIPDSQSVIGPPSLSIARRGDRIVLAGVAGTGTDEAGLRRRAERLFGVRDFEGLRGLVPATGGHESAGLLQRRAGG